MDAGAVENDDRLSDARPNCSSDIFKPEKNTLKSIACENMAGNCEETALEKGKSESSDDDEDSGDKLLMNEVQLPAPTPVTCATDEDLISEKDYIDRDETVVTVKFRTDVNETMTSAFGIGCKMSQVKERLAKMFKVNVSEIRLSCEGRECDDVVPLSGLGVEPLGTIELGLHSTDPGKVLVPVEFSRYIPIVDVITVRVQCDGSRFKDIVVEIENECFTKKWLGGYRHRITKVEYHHAEMQTLPRRRPSDSRQLHTTNTQTPAFPLKETAVNTNSCKATQVQSTDFHILPFVGGGDKLISSSAPTNGNTHLPLLVAVIIRIRRFCRHFMNRRAKREQDKKKVQKNRAQCKAIEPGKRMVGGSGYPVNRGDFHLLYLLIGKWWRREMTKIAATKTDESRKAALADLLNREVALISVVERQRIEANKRKVLKQELKHLEAVARPVIFRDSKGGVSSMDTLATQRARACHEMMHSFLQFNVAKEQRLDVLGNVRRLINTYQTNYHQAQEIINLLDRECQLLALGVDGRQVQGLRDRLTQLLFYFMHKYIIGSSPGAGSARPGAKPGPLHYCFHCRKLKPAGEFEVHVKMASFTTCRACQWTRNIGLERIDLSPFAKLLAQVRQTEMTNGSYSSVCYTLQVTGMYYLTRHVWYCRSIISDNQNLNDLQMARFRKEEDWSPWNCILLTSEEAAAHLDVANVCQFYSRPFLEKVRYRHMRAKNHFMPLILNDRLMAESNLRPFKSTGRIA